MKTDGLRTRLVVSRCLICALCACLLWATCATGESGHLHFLTVRGDQIMDGDEVYRFVSFNIPNLHVIEDAFRFDQPDPWRWPDEYEVTDALESIRQIGGKVVRIYVIGVTRERSNMGERVHVTGPGQFNEEAFVVLDRVLKIAHEKGVRIIIPLVDNWHWWGGVEEYASFRNKPGKAFWTDAELISDFKKTIEYVLNRRNTLTGTVYKNDMAIFGWETGNEIDSPPAWTKEIAACIKSLDKNHLVIDGNSLHGVQPAALADPNIDVVTTHHYPNANSEMVASVREALEQTKGKKPYFVGEFGFVDTHKVGEILDTVINSHASGAMLWSLRFHRREGGFYWHSEGAGGNVYKAYHWPGFDSGDPYDERDLLRLVRRSAFRIDGRQPPPVNAPARPRLLPLEEGCLSWQGSAGASGYDVQRATRDSGPWTSIASNISDADMQYRPLYCDTSATPGDSLFYRVIARNSAGAGQPSNVVGPVQSTGRLILDEFRSTPSTLRTTSGAVEWLTGNARRAQEDIHRLGGEPGASVTYRLPGPVQRFTLVAFRDPGSGDPQVLSSRDGSTYQQVQLTKCESPIESVDYDYWIPTSYSKDFDNVSDAATHFLKIVFPERAPTRDSSAGNRPTHSIELSRLQVLCGVTRQERSDWP